MKHTLPAVLLALLLLGLPYANALAQSYPTRTLGSAESKRAFNLVSMNDPAYKCVDVLVQTGIAFGYPAGTNTSRDKMTHYEFAVGTARVFAILLQHPTDAQKDLQQFQQELQDKLHNSPKAATALLALISEFEPEILALHQDVAGARQRIYEICPSILISDVPLVSAITPRPRDNVSTTDPAWDCLEVLMKDGVDLDLHNMPDFRIRMSKINRYEVAQRVSAPLWLLSHNGEVGTFSGAPLELKKPLEKLLKQDPHAVECLLALINEFQPELSKMGDGVQEAKQRLYAISPFIDVPYNDLAFKALGVLQDAVLVERYDMVLDRAGIKARSTTNTYSGNGQMTPYQFAVAVTESYPLPLPQATFATNSTQRKRADRILAANPFALQALQSLTDEFKPILDKLGQDVPTLNARLAALAVAPKQLPLLATKPFSDVPKDHWAYSSVEDVRAAGLVAGYPAGTYRTDDTP